MILDALLQLSDAQALTGAGGLSTNIVDLSTTTPQRDVGVGEPLEVAFSVDVAAFAGGTYAFALVQSANSDLSSADTLVTRTVLAATLTAGTRVTLGVPQYAITKRYLGVTYTLGGTTPTLTVTAFLQPRDMTSVEPKVHADAVTIS